MCVCVCVCVQLQATEANQCRGGILKKLLLNNCCLPVVDTCWCMAKPIRYCKVISLQLKKNNYCLNWIDILIFEMLKHLIPLISWIDRNTLLYFNTKSSQILFESIWQWFVFWFFVFWVFFANSLYLIH